MRKKLVAIIVLTISIFLITSIEVFALKENTHEAINEYIAQGTISGFSVDTYLKNNLGFTAGIQEGLYGYSEVHNKYLTQEVLQWLGEGGIQEDRPGDNWDFALGRPTRSVNHFHNPLKQSQSWGEAGLNDTVFGISYTGKSSILWAQDQNQSIGGQWSWQRARNYYYMALTGSDRATRQSNFANMFRAVGQQMHLVEDASVPEHVRNEAHGYGIREAYEGYVERVRTQPNTWNAWMSNPISFDKSILNISSLDTTAPVPISRIIDTDKYVGTNPSITKTDLSLPAGQLVGLAEYTNANFVSPGAMFTNNLDSNDKHYFTYPNSDNVYHWWDSTNSRGYIGSGGAFAEVDVEPVQHLAVQSLLYGYRMLYFPGQTLVMMPFGLDDTCREEYASKLIPRAIGYSAGLLNYFFRGTLGIGFPDTGVFYSIADGSRTPQQFTRIAAWIENTTANGEQIGAGTMSAVARYKIVPNYAEDLSNYPPNSTVMKNVEYSYSVSQPVSVNTGDIVPGYYTEFIFNFTNSPIPAGIADLTLQVVFKGTIGNESDNAVAVGMKDLMEPTHLTFWNSSDMFDLQYSVPTYSLYTFDQLTQKAAADNNLFKCIDFNNSGSLLDDPLLQPFDSTFTISLWNGFDWSSVTTVTIPPARHIRLIALVDSESDNYVNMEYTNPSGGSNSQVHRFAGVVNQADSSGNYSNVTPVKTFRKGGDASGNSPFYQHFFQNIFGCYPVQTHDADGNPVSCPYPEDMANSIPDPTPVSFTSFLNP